MSLAAEFVETEQVPSEGLLDEAVEHRADGYYVHTPGGHVLGPFDTRTQAGMEDMFWVNGAEAGDEDELFGESLKLVSQHRGRQVDLYYEGATMAEVQAAAKKIDPALGKMLGLDMLEVTTYTSPANQKPTLVVSLRALPRSPTLRVVKKAVKGLLGEADEPGQGEEPADSKLAQKLANTLLKNKAALALPFRQLWRHKYVKKNYDASQAWKLFYWAVTHGGAGGQGFNPATRKAASKLVTTAFSRWAKADMKAKVKRSDGMVEKSVGEISKPEFVKWFMSSAPAISEAGLHEKFVMEVDPMVEPRKPHDEKIPFDFRLRTAQEQGRTFKTGQAVEFRFMHNDERAPNVGGRFQQDIEPSGYYMTTAPDERGIEMLKSAGQKLTIGTAVFRNPLVLDWGMAYDQSSWKHRLWQHYGGKKRNLTKALRRDGYDGIVTVRRGVTSEIVALKGKPKMTESLSGLFVEQEDEPKPPKKKAPKKEPPEEEPEKDDLEKEEEKAEKLGYELKDVQAYFDMQIASGLDQGAALVKTKRKFKVRRLKISPIGKIMAPDIPDPEKQRKKQAAQAPPPPEEPEEEPEEPEEEPEEEPGRKSGRGAPTGGKFPEGPRGASRPSGPKGPPTPRGEE